MSRYLWYEIILVAQSARAGSASAYLGEVGDDGGQRHDLLLHLLAPPALGDYVLLRVQVRPAPPLRHLLTASMPSGQYPAEKLSVLGGSLPKERMFDDEDGCPAGSFLTAAAANDGLGNVWPLKLGKV
jgi:hypothetical protein